MLYTDSLYMPCIPCIPSLSFHVCHMQRMPSIEIHTEQEGSMTVCER